MEKACHTGFNVFFITSVLWQIVNLEIGRDLKFQRKKKGRCSESVLRGLYPDRAE